MSDQLLDDAALESYWKNGFVVVRGLFGPDDIRRWNERFEAIVNGEVPKPEGMLVMQDVMVAKGAVKPKSKLEATAKIQDYERDPVLYGYAEDDRLLDCIEQIVGHEVFSIHTMLINKPPGVDGRHPLHQDLLYFPFRPADKIVATWTAMDRVTKENGCLVAVPGSHRGELLPHENPDWEYLNMAYFGAKGVGADPKRVHLEMEPGDTVFFHPILLHGSGRNRTDGYRRAISAHYGSMECTWEWAVERFDGRRYKVVRGENAGGWWDGPRPSEGSIDPLDYIPLGQRPKRPRGEG